MYYVQFVKIKLLKYRHSFLFTNLFFRIYVPYPISHRILCVAFSQVLMISESNFCNNSNGAITGALLNSKNSYVYVTINQMQNSGIGASSSQ